MENWCISITWPAYEVTVSEACYIHPLQEENHAS